MNTNQFTAQFKFTKMPYTLTVTLDADEKAIKALFNSFIHTKTGQKIQPTKKEQRKMAEEYYTKAIPATYQALANQSGLSLVHQNQHPKYSKHNKTFEPIIQNS
jgi:3'-phosphoadenosine 5'-phosphosulfate sulfotransferase (PAPS reductase)/FAD synthetase